MKSLLVSVALGAGFMLSFSAYADAPAGSTAQCKDGTYYSGTSHKGACHGHQGVKEWLDGTAAATSTTKAATPAVAPTKTPPPPPPKPVAATPVAPAAPAAAATPAAPAMSAKHTAPTPASQVTAKPGGGAGLVWVNASSKVYHCQGDEWYGKTKEGSYMSETAAKAAGNHASHGKDCG